VLGEFELPIVKYRRDIGDEDGIKVLFTNTVFNERFFQPSDLDTSVEDMSCPFIIEFTDQGCVNGGQSERVGHLVGDVMRSGENEEIGFGGVTENGEFVVECIDGDGRRKYVCHQIEISDGVVVDVYEDVTGESTKQRFVDVLQRLFRHNLRNDLNVVMGHSEKLIEESEESGEESMKKSAREIRDKATQLMKLGKETQTIRDVINDKKPLTKRNLNSSVKAVVETAKSNHPDVKFDVTFESDGVIAGTHHVEELVEALVSNAIEHNTGDVKVVIEVQDDEETGGVELRVRDNGPGIPSSEQEIVMGNATITSLRHGSGLGLWVVRWVADRHGAKVRFDECGGIGSGVGTSVSVVFQGVEAINDEL
jgi:hypothetical protein